MVTVEIELPDIVIAAIHADPNGMERARAALVAAFSDPLDGEAVNTDNDTEKALDDYRAGVKARYRAKQEKRVAEAREASTSGRGCTPRENALDELAKDRADWQERDEKIAARAREAHLSTIPDILMHPEPDAIKKAMEDMDAGKGILGEDILAELRRPVG